MNQVIDRVAQAIVDGLNLKTTIGESERKIARRALAAIFEGDSDLEKRVKRLEIIVGHLCPDRSDDI